MMNPENDTDPAIAGKSISQDQPNPKSGPRRNQKSRGFGKSQRQFRPQSRGTPYERPKGEDRRGGPPSFEKKPKTIEETIRLVKGYRNIYCSTAGIEQLVTNLTKYYVSTDNQLRALVPMCLIKYVTSCVLYARLAQIRSKHDASSDVEDLDAILQLVREVELPEVIVRYIESFGTVTTPNGVQVIPTTADKLEDYFKLRKVGEGDATVAHFFDHRVLEAEVERFLQRYARDNPDTYIYAAKAARTSIAIRSDFLSFWKQNSRTARVNAKFRTVNWSESAGTEHLLVSKHVDGDTYTSYSACNVNADIARLGGAFAFRDMPYNADYSEWIRGDGNFAIQGRAFASLSGNDVANVLGDEAKKIA
jgi:hypothetical protein